MISFLGTETDKVFEDNTFWMKLVPHPYSALLGTCGTVTSDNHAQAKGCLDKLCFTVQAFSKSHYSEGRDYKLAIQNIDSKEISFFINKHSEEYDVYEFEILDKKYPINISSKIYIQNEGLKESHFFTLKPQEQVFLGVAIIPYRQSYFDKRPVKFRIWKSPCREERKKPIDIPLKYSLFGKSVKWENGKIIQS